MGTRGQTLHDYVAGITVFVVTIALVLGLLPNVLAPYQSDVGAATSSEAGRIGDRIVSNVSLAGTPNVLNATTLSALMAKNDAELQTRYGLEDHRHVNLTLTTLNGSAFVTDGGGTLMTAGDSTVGEDVSSVARIVSVSDPAFDCHPACRLVVRVW